MPRSDNKFTADEAGELLLKLRALDQLLRSTPTDQHVELGFDSVLSSSIATQTLPDYGERRAFFALVADCRRPDLIPAAYLEAYRAALRGLPYQNKYKCSDFKKGRDPTCSEALNLIRQIDKVLDTTLGSSFDAVNDGVKPFPFMKLPAELRLEVYSHFLPRPTHLSLFGQPTPAYIPPRLSLADILRTCHQISSEVIKYFYDKQTLFAIFVHVNPGDNLSALHLEDAYATAAAMSSNTRKFFNKLDIQVSYNPDSTLLVPQRSEMEHSFKEMLELFPNLDTIVFSWPLCFTRFFPETWLNQGATRVVASLIDDIPERIQILFDFSIWHKDEGKRILAEKLEARGVAQQGEGVARLSDPAFSRMPILL